MKQVVDFIHTAHRDWLHFSNNLRSHSPDVKLSKNQCLLARHWWVPANQMRGHSHGCEASVSQRRLTIYWKANERLGTRRASLRCDKVRRVVDACQSGPNCHVSLPTLFGARNVRASSPLFNNCGNKIGGHAMADAGKRRRWCCSTASKLNPGLGG